MSKQTAVKQTPDVVGPPFTPMKIDLREIPPQTLLWSRSGDILRLVAKLEGGHEALDADHTFFRVRRQDTLMEYIVNARGKWMTHTDSYRDVMCPVGGIGAQDTPKKVSDDGPNYEAGSEETSSDEWPIEDTLEPTDGLHDDPADKVAQDIIEGRVLNYGLFEVHSKKARKSA